MTEGKVFGPSWILYEDNHLLVLTKEPGLLSQADHTGEADLLTLAKAYLKERDGKPGAVYLGLVHRLDRNTGGVLCLAKTSKAAGRLSEQIRKHEWVKGYLALSHASATRETLGVWQVWEDLLLKDPETNRSVTGEGKKARLEQCLLAEKEGFRLRSILLESGRSHQIRVQLSSRGEPILGDLKYGAPKVPGIPSYFLGLWAWELELTHPVSREQMRFRSLPPASYPWQLFASAIEKAATDSKTQTKP